MRWWFGGSNAGYGILLIWALVNLICTWALLAIYETFTGDNALSVDSDIEQKITGLQSKIPKREIRNRSANGGRSPWILVWVLGPPAGGILMAFLPESPFIGVIAGFTLAYVIGHVVTDSGISSNYSPKVLSKAQIADTLSYKEQEFLQLAYLVDKQSKELLNSGELLSNETLQLLERYIALSHTAIEEYRDCGIFLHHRIILYEAEQQLAKITGIRWPHCLESPPGGWNAYFDEMAWKGIKTKKSGA